MKESADGGAGETVTRRLIIRGRVQGVWYRAWTVTQAEGLGLNGWVRNLSDGSVEALASGPEAAVEELIRRCWEGPTFAKVSSIDTEFADPPDEPGFLKKPTI
ncbi:MAG: acylphosphatase [Magnetovibrionaceae bacterium]